jgi:hypothetical protein
MSLTLKRCYRFGALCVIAASIGWSSHTSRQYE